MPGYIVRLTEAERRELEETLSKGRHAASTAVRARVLLKKGRGGRAGRTARPSRPWTPPVRRARQAFVEAVLRGKPGGHRARKLDGVRPGGGSSPWPVAPSRRVRAEWTLKKLLAERLVELEARGVGERRVRQDRAKKNEPKPWLKKQGVILARGRHRLRLRHGGRAGGLLQAPPRHRGPWSAWTSGWRKPASRCARRSGTATSSARRWISPRPSATC